MSHNPLRLRVLVIDEYFPFPLDSGKPIRTWNLLHRLGASHEITLLCYGSPTSPQAIPQELQNMKVEFVDPLDEYVGVPLYLRLAKNLFSIYPYSVVKHQSTRFQQRLLSLIAANSYDVVQCEWTPYAQFLNVLTGLPTFISTHNVESQIWFRRSKNSRSLWARLFFRLQAEKMKIFERRVLKKASWVSAVSEQDAQEIRRWGVERVSIVDNGVDLDFYEPDLVAGSNHDILFLASLDWQPNLDGLGYFLSDILPLIIQECPAAILTIAGRRPPADLAKRLRGKNNINFLGEISDVRPALQKAAVIVVPLRIGGGSRLKILEAMAMGKAIVSTKVGAEGLSVTDGQDLSIADAPADFARAVIRLLRSSTTRRQLGGAARQLVQNRYSWDESARKMEAAWNHAIRVHAEGSAQ